MSELMVNFHRSLIVIDGGLTVHTCSNRTRSVFGLSTHGDADDIYRHLISHLGENG